MNDGSILSAADLTRALTSAPIEAVIHCAVITAGSAREKADPETIVAVNIQGAVASLTRSVDLTQGYRFCLLWMGFLIGLILLAWTAAFNFMLMERYWMEHPAHPARRNLPDQD